MRLASAIQSDCISNNFVRGVQTELAGVFPIMSTTRRKPSGGFHEDGILEERVAGRRAREDGDSILDMPNLGNLTEEKIQLV